MTFSKRLLAHRFSPRTLLVLASVLFACTHAHAGTSDTGDELKLAIILSRHGVRSPLQSNEAMAKYASQPWPKWEVAPGIQTPRGNLLIALMGDYYRARFMRSGLLSGDPAVDGPLVFVRADNDQRTIETARIISKSLVPGGPPEVQSMEEGSIDPLFRPYRAHVGHPDPDLAAAAVLGRMGGNPGALERAYATQFAQLKAILYGAGGPPAGSPFDESTTVNPGEKEYPVKISGPFRAALVSTESLLLEYMDGMPAQDVGWGKVDGRALTDLLALNAQFFDLSERTRYTAQIGGSNLASHILDTLEQAALGQPVPGALGMPEQRMVVLVGHDTNIAEVGGLLGLNWWIPSAQANPVLPGGALVFELWRRGGDTPAFYVKVSYVAQTLEQLREASVLNVENPPGRSPIFVPGASGQGPDFDVPLNSLVRQARQVIDPSFVADER